MDELTFFESEALEASLAAASNHLNLRQDTPALAGAMRQSDADVINDFMVDLYQSAPADLVSFTESVVEPASLQWLRHAAQDRGAGRPSAADDLLPG